MSPLIVCATNVPPLVSPVPLMLLVRHVSKDSTLMMDHVSHSAHWDHSVTRLPSHVRSVMDSSSTSTNVLQHAQHCIMEIANH